MSEYTIHYVLGKHEGTVTAENEGMSNTVARLYAADHLMDAGIEATEFDVNGIEVEY